MSSDTLAALMSEIEVLPIYDIHTHIDFKHAFAENLGDIVGYHYYTELTNSAEYREEFIAEADPVEVVKQVWERLPFIENTVQYDWLMVIGEEFLGIRRHEWLTRDYRELLDRAQQSIDRASYRETVLEKSGIRRIYMTNQCDEDFTGLDTSLYVPCLRVDSFVFEIDNSAERERLERASGIMVRSVSDFERALRAVFERFAQQGMGYAAISTPPGLRTRPVAREDAARVFDQVLSGSSLDQPSRELWAAYALNCVCDMCRNCAKPLHLMVGVRRGAYPRGVTSGHDLMESVNSLAGYDYLFNEYWDVKFPLSVLADTAGLELAASAWIRHNVYPSGHWWYSNNPVDIARELRRRLDVVPLPKQIGYYSDAYVVEFILPKFRMYKFELARTLAERVERSKIHPNMMPVSLEQAVDMARRLLVDNPLKLFETAGGL